MESRPLDELLEEVRPSILALCYRLVGSIEDAEDLTQESLLKIAEGYDAFEGRSKFRTWACRIATNTCYNFLTSARKRREIVVPDPIATTDEFLSSVDPDAEPDAVRESLEFSFICVLQELSPAQRIVVVLRDVLGWSVQETAEGLKSNPAAIKNIHSRARKELRRRRPSGRTLSPSHPAATEFMHAFAKAHVARDIEACVGFYDEKSMLYMFPTRRYVGRKGAREFYEPMRDHLPTLFVGVKMNGSLGAACYHPTADGALERTGVAIVELRKSRLPYAKPRIAQVFWALQPEHHGQAPTPERLASAAEAKEVGQLL